VSYDLPPRNTGAFDLHLTDLEFEGLLAFLRSQQRIGRAWIFGSRRSGRRRPKDVVKPADIDVAVELVDVPEADTLLAMFDVRFAANDFFVHGHPYGLSTTEGQAGFVQIEFPGKEGPTVAAFITADGATLIFERAGLLPG
jgi:predicted nucleotidyltransferase